MNRDYIVTAHISDEMRDEAEKFSSSIAALSKKHRLKASKSYDYYGYLGHKAVENLLKDKNLEFKSDLTVHRGSDDYDILYLGDKIDVKASKNEGYKIDYWWKNQTFLVFESQIKRGVLQQKDTIIFCIVDDSNDSVHVFGAISVDDFLEKAEMVGPHNRHYLKWDSREISVHELKSFWRYILNGEI